MTIRSLLPLAAAALLSTSVAFANPTVKTDGGVLVNAKGMTLYTYVPDTAAKSACNGPCATNWPP